MLYALTSYTRLNTYKFLFLEELSNAMSMIQAITSKQEEMQQKIEQLQQEKRRESRKVKAKWVSDQNTD